MNALARVLTSAPRVLASAQRALRNRTIAVLTLVLVVASIGAANALTFPQLTGRVVDDAGVLDQSARAGLEQKLADFEAKTTGQLVVVTLKSLQGTSVEDYGYQLGRHWGIGQKEKNNGALLIIAPNERKARIEVGYGLEGQLTDAVSRLIIENSILPRFRAGDVAGGVSRGVDDIIQAVTVDPEEWKARAKQRPDQQPPAVDLVVLVLFFIVIFMIMRSIRQSSGIGRRGRSIFMPAPFPWGGGSSSSGSSWSGSSGGFSGGGGSFGGGGASGSW
jgi:uncharacterized protein